MSGGYATKSPPPAAFGVAAGAPQGQWSTGLFDCFDDPSNCFITCCCPCITFGQIAEIIDRGATSCFVGGLIYAVLGGCAYCYTCGFRTKLRGQHSLPEEPCADCCVHYCCTPCAICQEYRELKNRGYDPALGWATYAGQGGATAAPAMPGMMR